MGRMVFCWNSPISEPSTLRQMAVTVATYRFMGRCCLRSRPGLCRGCRCPPHWLHPAGKADRKKLDGRTSRTKWVLQFSAHGLPRAFSFLGSAANGISSGRASCHHCFAKQLGVIPWITRFGVRPGLWPSGAQRICNQFPGARASAMRSIGGMVAIWVAQPKADTVLSDPWLL